VIRKNFGDIHKLLKLPSLNKYRTLIYQNNCLKKRTSEQLKSWIEKKKKKIFA